MLQGLSDVIDRPPVFGKCVLLQRERPLFGPGQLQHVGAGRELYGDTDEKEIHTINDSVHSSL